MVSSLESFSNRGWAIIGPEATTQELARRAKEENIRIFRSMWVFTENNAWYGAYPPLKGYKYDK